MKRALSLILATMILFALAVPGLAAEDYPTNTEISFGFIDPDQFENICVDGTFRCGDDFEPGDYYIISMFDAQSYLQVTDTPSTEFYSDEPNFQVLKKAHIEEGQFAQAEYAMVIPADEIDTDDLTQYGIFEVGKDLPAGVYKVERITIECSNEYVSMYGILGAYQIHDGSLESVPKEADDLWNDQTYITLEDGQYIVINNLHLTLSGTTTHQASTPEPTPTATPEPTPTATPEPTPTATPEPTPTATPEPTPTATPEPTPTAMPEPTPTATPEPTPTTTPEPWA